MIKAIAKEAGVLRIRLESGSINIHEMVAFLKKVEALSIKKDVPDNERRRFLAQLENLERGRARKPTQY